MTLWLWIPLLVSIPVALLYLGRGYLAWTISGALSLGVWAAHGIDSPVLPVIRVPRAEFTLNRSQS